MLAAPSEGGDVPLLTFPLLTFPLITFPLLTFPLITPPRRRGAARVGRGFRG